VILRNKIISRKFIYLLALIILASLILIARRDVELLRLSHIEMVPQKIDNNIIETEDASKEAKTELSSASSDAEASTYAKASADKLVDKKATTGEPSSAEATAGEEEKLPDKILISVPFTSQAPLGEWDAYHEEACEEAALLMVAYYLQNKKLTPALAEKEIQALIAYEIKNKGSYTDSTAEEIEALGEEYYGIKNLRVVYDFSIFDLKKYLAKGKPIIVPAAGRLLNNPNFTAPGPLYHNLVLIGYSGNDFITNDPGTRKGEGYRYNIQILYKAIHDFPGSADNINQGRKAMLVLE
jgi:hypothetical protein